MTISIKHKFVNPKSDTGDATVSRASNWNDEHDITLAQNRVLGRVSAANGPVEELTGEQIRTISETTQAGVLVGINTRTASYTLVASDRGKIVEMNVASANTVTVPNEAGIGGVNYPIGTQIKITQFGTGQSTLLPAAGVTLRSVTGGLSTSTRYGALILYKRASNDWFVIDQTSAYLDGRVDALETITGSFFYQGGKASNPTLRNDGTALQTGDLYFNTTNDRMRVYETGTGWIDYEATAQTAATTATTQAGIATTQASTATAQAATATSQALTATSQAGLAATAKTAAESARDAALIQAGVYVDEATGRAAVADGVAFKVQGSGDVAAYEYRRTNSTTSVLIATYPAASLVDAIDTALPTTVESYGTTAVTGTYATGALYGIHIPYDCTVSAFTASFSATGTARYGVARRTALTGTLTHSVESLTDVSIATSGVSSVEVSALELKAGDIFIIGMSAGGGAQYTTSSTIGVYSLGAATVGSTFSAGSTYFASPQPSLVLKLVRAAKQAAVQSDIKLLQSGYGQSYSPSVTVLGGTEVGVSAGVVSGTVGIGETLPSGTLHEIRCRTNKISGLAMVNIAIWEPIVSNGLTYTCVKVIATAIMTDANGIAVFGLGSLGINYLATGCRITLYTSNFGIVSYGVDALETRSRVTTGGTAAVVGVVASLEWFNLPLAIQVTVAQTDALDIDDRVSTSETFNSVVSSAVGLETRQFGCISAQYDASSHSTAAAYEIPIDGTINGFSVDVTAPAVGNLIYLTKVNGSRYRIKSSTEYTAASAGLNKFTCSIAGKKGDRICFKTKSGGYMRQNGGVVVGTEFAALFRSGAVGDNVGVNIPYADSLLVTMSAPRVSALAGVDLGGKLVAQPFKGTSQPADWTFAGAWTVNDGLIPPVSGGYGVVAYHNEYTALARLVLSMRVTVTDTNSVFGLLTRQDSGSIAMVDAVAGKLLFRTWNPSLTSSAGTSVNLPFALNAGRDYTLVVRKTNLSWTATFTDTVTLQSVSVSETIVAGYRTFTGFPGVVFMSGNVKVKWFSVDAPYASAQARTLTVGDSNAEGSAALLLGATPWPILLEQNTASGPVVLANQSGEQSNFKYRAKYDLMRWRPRYVVLALGTNDSSLGFWRAYMSDAISSILSLGAEPILCTVPPRTGVEALKASMSADIRAQYFGPYRYIDFSSAITVGNDGLTADPAFYLSDGIHFSSAGHAKLYQQLLADAPFLVY